MSKVTEKVSLQRSSCNIMQLKAFVFIYFDLCCRVGVIRRILSSFKLIYFTSVWIYIGILFLYMILVASNDYSEQTKSYESLKSFYRSFTNT